MDAGTFAAVVTAATKETEAQQKLQEAGAILQPEKHQKYPKEHSLILWLLFGGIFAYIPVIYFTFSKKHKWHL